MVLKFCNFKHKSSYAQFSAYSHTDYEFMIPLWICEITLGNITHE